MAAGVGGEGRSGETETEAGTNGAQREVSAPSPQSLPSFPASKIYNLGTGTGYSVLQMVQAMEKASGKKVASPPCPTPSPPHTNIPDGHLSPTVYSSLPEALTPKSETLLHTPFLEGWSATWWVMPGLVQLGLHNRPLLQIPYKVVGSGGK